MGNLRTFANINPLVGRDARALRGTLSPRPTPRPRHLRPTPDVSPPQRGRLRRSRFQPTAPRELRGVIVEPGVDLFPGWVTRGRGGERLRPQAKMLVVVSFAQREFT